MVFSLQKKPVVLLSHRTGTGVIAVLPWLGLPCWKRHSAESRESLREKSWLDGNCCMCVLVLSEMHCYGWKPFMIEL